MARHARHLTVRRTTMEEACVVEVSGVLDSVTYLEMRDTVIKAAMDQPRVVLVEVTSLAVPAPTAWSVFTSARWHVCTWPDVPILLVCAREDGRAAIRRNGVARYVPVYPSVETALSRLNHRVKDLKRRISAELPAEPASLRRARRLVEQTLVDWSQRELVSTANVVVNVFVENVLEHTESSPVVVLESNGATVVVAVQDNDDAPAVRHEDRFYGGERVSGLAIVAAVSRAWGNIPTLAGKTVWAVIGQENKL